MNNLDDFDIDITEAPDQTEEDLDRYFDDMGIVLWGHSLVWGHKSGWLRWAPKFVRSTIVRIFNHITCFIFGHSIFGPIYEDGVCIMRKVCTSCCKEWRDVRHY